MTGHILPVWLGLGLCRGVSCCLLSNCQTDRQKLKMLTYHTSPPSNNVGVVARRVLFRPRMQARRTSRAWAGTPLLVPPPFCHLRKMADMCKSVCGMDGRQCRASALSWRGKWMVRWMIEVFFLLILQRLFSVCRTRHIPIPKRSDVLQRRNGFWTRSSPRANRSREETGLHDRELRAVFLRFGLYRTYDDSLYNGR